MAKYKIYKHKVVLSHNDTTIVQQVSDVCHCKVNDEFTWAAYSTIDGSVTLINLETHETSNLVLPKGTKFYTFAPTFNQPPFNFNLVLAHPNDPLNELFWQHKIMPDLTVSQNPIHKWR